MSQLSTKQHEAFERARRDNATTNQDSRVELEDLYIGATLRYLELATDEYHTFAEEDVRDRRFNLYHAINSYPRFPSLSQLESPTGVAYKHTARELYTGVLIAQLSLLADRTITNEELDCSSTQLHPSLVYADLLRKAGVFTDGVYTRPVDTSLLTPLMAQAGVTLTLDTTENGGIQTTTKTVPTIQQLPHSSLELVA